MFISDFIIGFERKRILVKHDKPQEEPRSEDFLRRFETVNEELFGYGYSLDPELRRWLTDDDLTQIYEEVIRIHLDKDLGFSGSYSLRYPGFPQQVIGKEDWELMKEAERIYNAEKTIPEEQAEWNGEGGLIAEEGEKENVTLKPMTLSEFLEIPVNLLSSGTSLSEFHKEELIHLCENWKDSFTAPTKIPFKENLALALKYLDNVPAAEINDILRFAIVEVGGDASLPHIPKEVADTYRRGTSKRANPKWRQTKSFSNPLRRKIMSLIEGVVATKGIGGTVTDAKTSRFYGSWLFLNERIHPQSYRLKYPLASEFFKTLLTRSKSKMWKTWNSKLQDMYQGGKGAEEITKFVSGRPGELVRRIDSLMRRGMKENKLGEVFDIFLDTDGMANKTLLELYNYYEKQEAEGDEIERTIRIREGVKKIPNLPKLPVDIREEVIEFILRKILINIDRRQDKDSMKDLTVYIDPAVKDIPLPIALRWSDSSLPAGTVFNIPDDKKYLSVFTQWIQQGDQDEDLDLHGFLCNPEEKKFENIGWNTGLKGEDLCAIHSGDVLNKPGECQETILINLDRALTAGYTYIVFTVRNYKGRYFDTLQAWLGYDFASSFEKIPKNQITKNPEFKTVLNLKSLSVSAFLLDLKARKLKICSFPLDELPTFTGGHEEEGVIVKFAKEPKFTCYELLQQYYTSSGATLITELPDELGENGIKIVAKEDVLYDMPLIQKVIGE